METKNINKVFDIINTLNKDKREYIEKYFSNAPMWLLESLQVFNFTPKTVFVKENSKVDTVFILLKGIVRAVDYRVSGIAYDFMWFYSVSVFGAMEILIEDDYFQTTLETVSDCTMLLVSKEKFEMWMRSDINSLQILTSTMVGYLLEQSRKERIFLFTQGKDRIMLIFSRRYEQSNSNEQCIINLTRQELADISGLSIKTINRAVKKLAEENFISRDGNKIIISKKQYDNIQNYISNIIED